jgi:hypothetical protein
MESEEDAEAKNSTAQLSRLVEAVKVKLQNAPPFLVVFNSEADSKNLQENFDYPHIMATSNALSVDILVRMAEIFEKKMMASTVKQKTKVRGQNDQKIFLKKTNLASISEILIPITVVKLSETDMILQSETPLTVGMNLHLLSPVDMFVNIQPTKTQSKTPEYHGLIHALGEDEKKELRKFVNSVFFREHDAKVTAETEGFRQLNEAKLQQKEEALKKQEEEALKAQAESARDNEEALEKPESTSEP